jgi:hypothetical protein
VSKLLIKTTPIPSIQSTVRIRLTADFFCLVSERDYEWLKFYDWRLFNGKYKKYAYHRWQIGGQTFTAKMHREIMSCTKAMETHHIDLNGLNNTRENLVNLTPLDHRLAHGKSR